MIKIKNVHQDNLITIICYITQSGYKVVVESHSNKYITIPVYDISILTKGDAND